MKKVVFLLILALFTSIQSTHASTTTTYQFDGYELRLTYTSDDHQNRGYEIQKVGSNPFSTMVMYEGCIVRIKNVLEVEGNHLFYGYIHDDQADTFYDSFLLVLDESGDVVTKKVIDYGQTEEIIYVGLLDTVITVVSLQSVEDEREDLVFDEYQIASYDYDYNLLNTVSIPKECEEFINTDYLLLGNQDYDDTYDYALTQNLDIISKSDPLDIPTDTVYQDEVYIPFLNTALLNNKEVKNGILIDYPGDYELVYQGFTYQFSVESSVSGIEDNAVYDHEVTPMITSGNIYLNNDLFVSGTTISKPGDYLLEVHGSNNYLKTYHFTVSADVQGVIHNQVYTDDVDLSFNGNGYLNNAYITSPYTVSDPGEYVLKIKGEHDYTETYFFTIKEPEDNRNFVDFIQKYDIFILVVVVISGLLILKKK